MHTRLLIALLLVPALAACSAATTPSSTTGGTPSATGQVKGQITGSTPTTRVKAVLQGSSTVRGADTPVANGAFTYALPTDSSVTGLATGIGQSTFGAAQCAGSTQTVSNADARVVQLAFFDAFNGSAAAGHLEAGTPTGNTTMIYAWVYATAAVNVSRKESCTVSGHALQDTLDLKLSAGWNSVVGTRTVAADGSVTSTYFTQPVGTVPFLLAGN